MKESFESICPNCFSDGMQNHVCGKCGYDEDKSKSNALALPKFTVLNSRYLVGRIIGSGGFGITYKAYDITNNAIRAIKEYVPMGVVSRRDDRITMTENSDSQHDIFVHGKRRFYEEAMVLYACSGIKDVVEIVDYFQENNTVYFVMEFINGITLRRYVVSKGGRLDFDPALKIISSVGRGLDQVHQKTGIFHRDISPENIMVSSEGEAKIIDFGNAKNIDRQKQNLSVVLKPGFAPPEQYSSQSRQGRYTDVYALAGTFYYMLTGKMIPVAPDRLTGSSYTKLLDAGIGVNQETSDVVDHALELDYRKRYQTVGEFIDALEKASSALPPSGGASRELEQPPAGSIAYVEVLDGIMKGAVWNFPGGELISIGRTAGKADIVLEGSREISKVHLLLEFRQETKQFYIEDMSKKGTRVDGYLLERNKKYVLDEGSILVLGTDACVLKIGVK